MKLENTYYNQYIQLFYLGLNEFEYKGEGKLYRGTSISEDEINKLYDFYKNKFITNNEFQSSYLIYSRAYLSFSTDRNISLKFIRNIQNKKKVLFQIENNLNNKINNKICNADLYNISFIQNEKEILFFPFSSFIIKDIKLVGDIYYINLLYLGIYENFIKRKMDEMKEKNVPIEELDSPFSEHVLKQEIIPKNNEKYSKGLNNNEFCMIKNYCKKKNYVEPPEKTFKTIQNISKKHYNNNIQNISKKHYNKYDYFKVILLGNAHVGKTSLCRRMINKKIFNESYNATICINIYESFRNKNDITSKTCKIWDTSGQERYRVLTRMCFININIILLVYDVTDHNSFNDLNEWLLLVKDYVYDDEDIIKILIGNKCDMDDKRIITERQGREFAAIYGFKYIETSAKENINIQELLELIKINYNNYYN